VSDKDLRIKRKALSSTDLRHFTYFVDTHLSGYQGSDDQQGKSKLEKGRNGRHCDLLVLLYLFR
jgi:hypothetical protein